MQRPCASEQNKFWGNNYSYDAWGNLTNKKKISTACAGELLNAPALVNNQLSGYGYDAAGNMTSDPTDQTNAVYDAESRIKSLNSGTASYTYKSLGNRVRKDITGGTSTEYFYFNGQVMAAVDRNPGSSQYRTSHFITLIAWKFCRAWFHSCVALTS